MHIAKILVDNDPALLKKAEQIADKCEGAAGERCDQAVTFTHCLHDSINEVHVDVEIV